MDLMKNKRRRKGEAKQSRKLNIKKLKNEEANAQLKSERLMSKNRGLELGHKVEPFDGGREIIIGFEKNSQLTPSTSRSGNVSFGHSEVDHILEKYNIFDFREMRHPGKYVLISEQLDIEKVVSELRNIKPTIRLAVPNTMMYLDDTDPTRDRGIGVCCIPGGSGCLSSTFDQPGCENYYYFWAGSIWRGDTADGNTCDDCKGACCTFNTPLSSNYYYPDGGSCDLNPTFNCTCVDNVYWGDCDGSPDDNDSIFAGFGTTCASGACEDPDTFAWSRATADSWAVWYDNSSHTWIQKHSGNFSSPMRSTMPRVPHADLQFNLQNMGYPGAWDYEPVSENVVVAVIDTGVGGFQSSFPEWHRHDCWSEKVDSGIIEKHETAGMYSANVGNVEDIDRYGGIYHGSACISVIGARHYNDDWGIKGACPHCKMVSVRNFDWHCTGLSSGNNAYCSQYEGSPFNCVSDSYCQTGLGAKTSHSANAIQYIAEHYGRDSGYDGCIMNMSFGSTWQGMSGNESGLACPDSTYDAQCGVLGDTCGPSGNDYNCEPDPRGMFDEINYAIEQGCILVAAAGNSDLNLEPFTEQHPDAWHHSPSGYPGVIEVAATRYAPYYQSGLHNRKSSYSNYGETINIAATVNYYMANLFSAGGVDVDDTCNNTLDCSYGFACVDMDVDSLSGYEINPWLGADSFCESGGASCIYDYDNDIWTGCCCRPYENEYGLDHGVGGHDHFWYRGSGMPALTPTGWHSGTSAATPEIAGILGYMKSLSPGYDNNDQIINALYDTATNIDSTNTNDPYGTGDAIGPNMLGEGLANAYDALYRICPECLGCIYLPDDMNYAAQISWSPCTDCGQWLYMPYAPLTGSLKVKYISKVELTLHLVDMNNDSVAQWHLPPNHQSGGHVPAEVWIDDAGSDNYFDCGGFNEQYCNGPYIYHTHLGYFLMDNTDEIEYTDLTPGLYWVMSGGDDWNYMGPAWYQLGDDVCYIEQPSGGTCWSVAESNPLAYGPHHGADGSFDWAPCPY